MPTRTESTLVAVFGNPSEAQAAAKELLNNAFAGDHIHVVPEVESRPSDKRRKAEYSAGLDYRHLNRCFSSIFGQASNAERQHYAEAVHEGKAVVAVSAPDQMANRVAEILSHHAPVEAVLWRVAQGS